MLTKHLLTISLVLPLLAVSATANASSTIKDQSYRQSAQSRAGEARNDLNSAFAYDRAASSLEPEANSNVGGFGARYHGGPKYPW
jgi:hypothetical protein